MQAAAIGAAGEHLVCADLIIQGFPASLAAAGSPFDIIVVTARGLVRVQVRTTTKPITYTRTAGLYRFVLRCGKGNRRTVRTSDVDVFAFVALDTRQVAYLRVGQLMNVRNGGRIKQCIEFSPDPTIERRRGKPMADYKGFPA